MIKKIPMIVLMTIIIYSIIPLITIISLLKFDYMEMMLNELFIFSIITTYILSFVELYFFYKQQKYYKLIKLSLIVKLLFVPVIFSLIILGILTLLIIIGSGIILLGVLLGIFIILLTSLYSSFGIYLYYKSKGIKCNKLLLVLQWCFPLDIISLIIFMIKISKDNQ